ncbi:MAG: DUF3365 domain-containing protein, partial [Thiohalocapsa sp.]
SQLPAAPGRPDQAGLQCLSSSRQTRTSASRLESFVSAYPLEPQMHVQFLPHSIPSFAAQSNFRLVQKKLPEYSYHEPTLNPTNLNDKASDWEANIINDFRGNPGKTETIATRNTPAGSFLTLARPLKVGSAACLNCHSKPEVAPATMVALYGSQHGFGWKQGETVGAQVVSIPLTVPLHRAYHNLFLLMGALTVAFLLILLIVDTLMRALVVKPVIGISEMASDVSMGRLDAREYRSKRSDEIGSLASSFNRMRVSLQQAMKMLDERG